MPSQFFILNLNSISQEWHLKKYLKQTVNTPDLKNETLILYSYQEKRIWAYR